MQRLIFLVILFLALSINVQAETNKIKAIVIEGNTTIGSNTILEAIETKIGDKFSKQTIDKDIKAIYKLGYFSDINVDIRETTEGLDIAFIVVERPLAKKIIFAGNKEIKEEELKKEVSVAIAKPISLPKIKKSVNKLTSFYKDKGYYFVNISSEIKETEGIIIFNIQEGKKIKIQEINLSGNKSFSNFKLKWKMATGRGDIYKEEELQRDIEKLDVFYKSEGYPLISISQPEVTYDEKKKGLIINISISEGKQFKVQDVKIIGNTILSTKELFEAIKIKKGNIYNLVKISLDRETIKSMYLEKGYALVQVLPIPDMNTKESVISLVFKIQEGEICYIESIQISGNTTTKDKVIRREMLIKEGETYDGKKIRNSRQKLINLGFFEGVSITTLPGRQENKQILDVKVKEGRTGNIVLSAGYGNKGLFGVVQVDKNNLFGKGWSTYLKAERGENLSNYEFGFTEPWFRDTPTSVGFDIWNKETKEGSSYTEKRIGSNIRVGRPWKTYNKIYLKYKYEEVKIIAGTTSDTSLKDWTDTWGEKYVPGSSLSAQIVRNTKKGEDILNPSSGYEVSLSNEIYGGPLGGKINFYKPTIESSCFIPSWKKFTLALHINVGLVSRLYKEIDSAEKNIPVYEKFKIGGPKSLRGYGERSIYPENSNGGNAFLVGNIEYRYPLTDAMSSALFFDFGDCWDKGNLKMKYGTGIGIRFKTPIGPITLDYAWRLSDVLSQKKGDTEFHFSIGPPF